MEHARPKPAVAVARATAQSALAAGPAGAAPNVHRLSI